MNMKRPITVTALCLLMAFCVPAMVSGQSRGGSGQDEKTEKKDKGPKRRANGLQKYQTFVYTSEDLSGEIERQVSADRDALSDRIDALFDRVLTSEDFTASKPAPDCYLLGAKIFGLDIDECVVFEDAINGLQAGMASGIYTIGITTTNTPDVVAQLSHHVIKDFTELDYDKVVSLLREKN